MSQERGNWEWVGATMVNMQAEIDRLKARVAELEGKATPNYFGMMGHKPGCPILSAAGNPKCTCGLL